MSKLNTLIARAATEGLSVTLMASPVALIDMKVNTDPRDWQTEGNRLLYRAVPIEVHDEWSWGWMLRNNAGGFVGQAA